jgi:hypothetical protein
VIHKVSQAGVARALAILKKKRATLDRPATALFRGGFPGAGRNRPDFVAAGA